jgi:hypothetical protein
MEEYMTWWDPPVASGEQRPPHPVHSGESRMWDFRPIDPNSPDDLDPLVSDRDDGLDQRCVTGCAKPTTEITASARFVDESRS